MMPRRLLVPLALLLATACGKDAPQTQTPAASGAAPAATTEAEDPEEAKRPDVDPIPEGWTTLTPQLSVPDVDAALEFYTATFGATTKLAVKGPDGATFHAEIQIGDSLVLLERESEEWMSPDALGWTSASLLVYVDNADATFKKALKAGASSEASVEEMYWGDRYGQFRDPAGHRWGVATRVEELTDAQITERLSIINAPPPKKKKPAQPAVKKKKKNGWKPPPPWKRVHGRNASSAQPSDHHTVTIALTVPDAAAAIAFYTQVFEATERRKTMTKDGKKVMYAELEIGDSVIALADPSKGPGGSPPKGDGSAPPIMIHHYGPDADRLFHVATGAGADVVLATQDTFWGDRFGAIVGPDGYGWGLATRIEELGPDEIAKRLQDAAGGPPPEPEPPAEPATTETAAGGGATNGGAKGAPPPPPPPPAAAPAKGKKSKK